MMKKTRSLSNGRVPLIAALSLFTVVAVWVFAPRDPQATAPIGSLASTSEAAAPDTESAPAPGPAPAEAAVEEAAPPSDRPGLGETLLRPLPVAMTSATHEWTAGDGFDLAVIERIAHSPDELRKLVEENGRIKRRQLVYRNETAALVIQRARLTGEPVRRLTLPALDGEELDFVIDRADLAPSGQSGTFTGRLADRPDSLVTLAFRFGREAFTVLSPADDLYLQADPREPGEIIVKSIDPAVYAHARCGNPDHNH
jgi:hypothetical protein